MMTSYPTWRDWQRLSNINAPAGLSASEEANLSIQAPFLLTARPCQRPPMLAAEGGHDWRTWLFMGGRGAGKTRTGAEFVRFAALYEGARRIALIGPTFADVRNVMVEGESGLLSINHPKENQPLWYPSRGLLVFSSGARAYAYSAEDPDSLRGPQFDLAWCDELGAWARGEAVWDMLQMALRLGPNPRCVATTTPRRTPLVRRLVNDPGVYLTRSSTRDNADHLPPAFLAEIERTYGGTQLGRQELDGELIEDVAGALWKQEVIDRVRITSPPRLDKTIVAVDPPAGRGPNADACGIVAAGSVGRVGYVIADETVSGVSPAAWAGCAVSLAQRVGAREIVVEANQGGEMARYAIETVCDRIPVRLVRAIRSKLMRASPVATLYEHGRVFHVGRFAELEDEMCRFGGEGFHGSPDRLDALVWALWSLLLDGTGEARIRTL